MKGNFKATNALTLVSDPQFSTAVEFLPKLQRLVEDQLQAVARMERDAALHAIVVGLTLHRIKASLRHGEWGKWQKASLEKKKSQVNYYMRLGLVFLEQAGVTKPDLLALPGESFSLSEVGDGPAKKLFRKAVDFVGDHSLNELLQEHGIKDGSGRGSSGAASGAVGDDNDAATAAEWLLNLRQTYLDPEKVKTFPAKHLKTVEMETASFLSELRKMMAALRVQ